MQLFIVAMYCNNSFGPDGRDQSTNLNARSSALTADRTPFLLVLPFVLFSVVISELSYPPHEQLFFLQQQLIYCAINPNNE